jgi:hypothetical protein
VTITAPLDGSSHPVDAPLTLRATVTDPQGSAFPDATLRWTYNGTEVGTGANLVVQPTGVGPATIALTATNGAGLSATSAVSVQIVAATGLPSVVITAPANQTQYTDPATVITFTAIAHPGGAAIPDAAIVWTDDVDGPLGTGATLQHRLSNNSSSMTQHNVTVTVTDAAGHTATDTIIIYVGTLG